MNLHSTIRYPFLKYIIEEFAGTFYEDETTSLNRLLILYHNRYSFTVRRNDVGEFISSHEKGISKPDWFHWWFSAARRKRIQQVKRRTAFALRHNRETFERLLSRRDYASQEAVHEALTSISEWLQTLSSETVTDKLLDLENWKVELALLVQEARKAAGQLKNTSRVQMTGHFHEQFVGESPIEKLDKFNRLKKILLKHQWIVPIGDTGTYRYCKQSKGGRLYIAALYYVLFKKGHIDKIIEATQIALIFNTWLIHDFEQSSFVKAFQAEELAQFNCAEGHGRYKYVEEARLVLAEL